MTFSIQHHKALAWNLYCLISHIGNIRMIITNLIYLESVSNDSIYEMVVLADVGFN